MALQPCSAKSGHRSPQLCSCTVVLVTVRLSVVLVVLLTVLVELLAVRLVVVIVVELTVSVRELVVMVRVTLLPVKVAVALLGRSFKKGSTNTEYTAYM